MAIREIAQEYGLEGHAGRSESGVRRACLAGADASGDMHSQGDRRQRLEGPELRSFVAPA